MRPFEQMQLRRRKETQIEDQVRSIQAQKETTLRANWENKTDEKLVTKRKKDRVSQLRAQQQAGLMQRRRQLASLLNAEMAAWQQAINTSSETSEDRKNSLRMRALKLRDAREAERRAFVDKCYSQQWRDSCDDARTLDSKALLHLVSDTRRSQLDQKRERLAKEAEAEDAYLGSWRERIGEVEKRETAKEEARRKMDREVKGILDQQVVEHGRRKGMLRAQQDQEAKEELDLWETRKRQEESEALEKLKSAYDRGQEIRKYNTDREHLTRDKDEMEKAEDLMLLRYALDKEKADEEFELRKKLQERDATKQFQEFLRVQMAKEAEDTAQVDELTKAAEEAIWEKKEAEQRKQREAREYLMAEVDRGRQQQIKSKFQSGRLDLEDDVLVGAKFKEQQKQLDQIELEKEAARKQARIDNMLGIRAQAAMKDKSRMKEEQTKFLSTKLMNKMEEEHGKKLALQAGVARTFYPIKQTQWYT